MAHKPEDPSLVPGTHTTKLDAVVHILSLSSPVVRQEVRRDNHQPAWSGPHSRNERPCFTKGGGENQLLKAIPGLPHTCYRMCMPTLTHTCISYPHVHTHTITHTHHAYTSYTHIQTLMRFLDSQNVFKENLQRQKCELLSRISGLTAI